MSQSERTRDLTSDQLHDVRGGVEIHTASALKDPWPVMPPRDPAFPGDDAEWAAYWQSQQARGAGSTAAAPVLRVARSED